MDPLKILNDYLTIEGGHFKWAGFRDNETEVISTRGTKTQASEAAKNVADKIAQYTQTTLTETKTKTKEGGEIYKIQLDAERFYLVYPAESMQTGWRVIVDCCGPDEKVKELARVCLQAQMQAQTPTKQLTEKALHYIIQNWKESEEEYDIPCRPSHYWLDLRLTEEGLFRLTSTSSTHTRTPKTCIIPSDSIIDIALKQLKKEAQDRQKEAQDRQGIPPANDSTVLLKNLYQLEGKRRDFKIVSSTGKEFFCSSMGLVLGKSRFFKTLLVNNLREETPKKTVKSDYPDKIIEAILQLIHEAKTSFEIARNMDSEFVPHMIAALDSYLLPSEYIVPFLDRLADVFEMVEVNNIPTVIGILAPLFDREKELTWICALHLLKRRHEIQGTSFNELINKFPKHYADFFAEVSKK